LEKFPGYGGENSKSSAFAATIINQFAGADTQNAVTSGDYRLNAVGQTSTFSGRIMPYYGQLVRLNSTLGLSW
jgi:hypothetical protein